MKQLLCPKCFASYSLDQCAYVCTSAGCAQLGVAQTVTDSSDEQRPVCSVCQKTMFVRQCPSCGYEISEDAVGASTEALPISIIGAEHCGKSNYLSVLIDSIKNDVGKMYGCSLYPLGGDATIKLYESEYYRPLFVEGKCVSSTEQEIIAPLVYSLVFADEHVGKTCNVTFYDACGANFDSVRVMNEHNRSIYNSRGIMFLLDPTQLPAIQEHLLSHGMPVTEGDPTTLLSRTIHLVRNGLGIKSINQKIDIPIAVCLTKMDILRPILDNSSFLRYPSRHLQEAAFDKIDFDCCDLEVQSLIESWSGKELINLVQSQFETSGFFSFSSLGNQPGHLNELQRLAPHRVTDPFLWLLWKNQMIRAK